MAIRFGRPVKRWGQMTYTSADSADISGHGGWGVKESTPGLTPRMVERLMSGVSTRLDGVPELSNFPSGPELAARARRMAYHLDDGRVTLWHAVEAGCDASGRPGNVFAHVAVEPAEGSATRPIEYWRSADWLVPFGAPEVAKARIPSALRPDGAVSHEAFLDFIEVGERLFVLRWLLDAVAWAVETSSSAALVTDTADEAAGWLAAFSYLTAPQLAQRISFVTFERANTLGFATQQGFRVICLPRVDWERLDAMQGPFLLLDPRWELDEREAAERKAWRLPTGRSMPTTRWPEWALDLASLGREHALAVLGATDEIGGQLPPGAAVPLHWPLSVAMMLDKKSVIMARSDKVQEILGSTPAELLGLPACTSLMDELVSCLDAEGWRRFVAANGDRAALRERVALVAVDRAKKLSEGGGDDVLEAARITSLLLDLGLQPVPENDADIPALEPVLERLQERFREPDLAALNQDGRFSPHLVLDAPPAERVDAPREGSLRAEIAEDIAKILYEMPAGSAECAAVARAVCVAAGLEPGVLPTVDELTTKPFLALACANSLVGPEPSPRLLLDHGHQILSLNREPAMSVLRRQSGLPAAIQRALTSLAILQALDGDGSRTEVVAVATVAPLIEAGEEAHLASMVHMLESGSGPEPDTDSLSWAASLVVATGEALSLHARSVLTVPAGEGDLVGWALSRRLASSGRYSAARLRGEIDIKLLAITDDVTRARVDHQIHRFFEGQAPEPWPLTDESTKRS
jgi:GTPase-associated protein 1, N-terminal domain type 2/GTPase-associated protein 1, middle domain